MPLARSVVPKYPRQVILARWLRSPIFDCGDRAAGWLGIGGHGAVRSAIVRFGLRSNLGWPDGHRPARD